MNGDVKVSQEKGSVKIEQVTGDVHVEGRVNEVSVSDVKGAVQLDGEFQESVKLARISKTVTFKSSRTDMEFSRIEGTLDLDSDELHAEQLTGPVHLTTRSKNIRLEEVSGDVRLQDDNGTIELGMRTLGNVQIDSRNGDIQLSLPDKAGFRLDAQTRDGEIQSDFPELKVNNDEHEAKASGSVGNGSSHIVLNNEHDGIEIRKASCNAAETARTAKPQVRQGSARAESKSRADGKLKKCSCGDGRLRPSSEGRSGARSTMLLPLMPALLLHQFFHPRQHFILTQRTRVDHHRIRRRHQRRRRPRAISFVALAQIRGHVRGHFALDFVLVHAALLAHYGIGIQKNFQIGVRKNLRSDVATFHHHAAASAHRALMRHHPLPHFGMHRHARGAL